MPFTIQKRDKMTKDISLATTEEADPGMSVYYEPGSGTPYLPTSFAQYSTDSGTSKEPSQLSNWNNIFTNGLSNWFDIKLRAGECRILKSGSTTYDKMFADYDRGVFHIISFQIAGSSFQSINADDRWMRFDMRQILPSGSYITGVEITPLKTTLDDYCQKFCVYPCVGDTLSNRYIYVGIDEYVKGAYGFQVTVHAISLE